METRYNTSTMRTIYRYLLLPVLIFALLGGFSRSAIASSGWASNAYEVIDAVNGVRASQGLPALQPDGSLMAAAQGQSDYQASIGTVTHTGPGDSRPADRASAAGYGNGQAIFISENIWGGGNASAQQAVNWWTGDAPHWNTMMNVSATHIGAGVAETSGATYYTIVVGYISGQAAQVTPGVGVTPPAPGTPGATALPIYPVYTSTPGGDGSVIHEVQFGHTLIGIANAYGITLADLLARNGLQSDAVIYPGEKLIIIPGPTATLTPTITETPGPTTPPSRTPRPRTPTAVRAAATRTITPPQPTAVVEPTSSLRLSDIRIDNRTAGIVIVSISAIGLVLLGLTAFRKK